MNSLRPFAVRFALACPAILVGLTSCRTGGQEPLLPPRTDSYFGLNGSKAYHIPEKIDTEVEQRLQWMDELGVTWDRSDIWWHVTEPSPGTWDFSRGELVFDKLESHGVQWYPILCYGAAWFDPGRNAPQNEEEYQAFAEYVEKTVGHFKGRAEYWSLWNEPNIPNFWSTGPNPDRYARLLELSYEAAKRADPDAKICAPAMAPLGQWDRKYMERLYQLGAAKHFDVFDYHYYRNHPPEEEVPAELAEIRAVMARNGDAGKPVWISESGVTGIVQSEEELDRQAALVVRNQLLCLSLGVERFFYFDLQNWYDDEGHPWDAQLGLVSAAGNRKPAFHAYKTMVREVDRRHFVGRCAVEDGAQGVLIYDDKTGVYTLAAWTGAADGSAATAEIALMDGSGLMVDPWGGEHELATGPAEIDRHPRYFRPVDPAAYLPDAGTRLEPALTILSPGEEAPFGVYTHPLMGGAEVTVTSLDFPDGITWDQERVVIRLEKPLPAGKVDVAADVTMRWRLEGKERVNTFRRVAQVEVIPTMELSLRPVLRDGGLMAVARLDNKSQSRFEKPLTFASADGERDQRVGQEMVTLGAGESRTVEFPVSKDLLDSLAGPAVWSLEYGDFRSKPFRVYIAPLSDVAPVIDGDLREYEGVKPMRIDDASQVVRNFGVWNTANASAEVWYRFTPDAIHVAARIRDNDPVNNPNKALEMWKGDAMELYIGLAGPSDRSVLDKSVEFQIGLAPTTVDGKPVVFWFHKDVPIAGASLAVKKADGGCTMEAAIPLEAIGRGDLRITDGMLLGLDAALDDLDAGDSAPAANNPGRALIWNGTGMNWIDPSNWGMAVVRRVD